MKVHIAYDDGELVGVYPSKSAAAHNLSLQGAWIAHLRDAKVSFGDWTKTGSGIERIVSTTERFEWEQWIDTYEVTK